MDEYHTRLTAAVAADEHAEELSAAGDLAGACREWDRAAELYEQADLARGERGAELLALAREVARG